eukprot:447949-Pleurochrysis_carterae.AAC.1
MELSSARSTSFAPSTPFAVSSHALSTASSCACSQQRHYVTGCLLSPSAVRSPALHCLASHLLLLLHTQCVFRSRRLLLCPRRCCLPPCPGHEFLLTSGLLCAIFHQPLAVFAVCARAQLTPTPLLVQYECPPYRVENVCRFRFDLPRAFMVLRVKRECGGPPTQLLPRRRGVSELAFVRSGTRPHSPHVHVELLNAVYLYPS